MVDRVDIRWGGGGGHVREATCMYLVVIKVCVLKCNIRFGSYVVVQFAVASFSILAFFFFFLVFAIRKQVDTGRQKP